MSKPIIEIEGLGKSYRIGANREKYLSLRDEMARKAHGFARCFLSRHHHIPKDEEFWALKDVSFSVQEGEAVGIIGRNGAGKSTLLKILSRITPPSTGKITLRGRIASLLEVGTGFHPELTGRENIFLNGAILGMTRSEIKRKFDEIVAFSEVEKFLDTPVKRFSSGMYVRLAFAVAAHLEPEILVVDEVLAVGDAEFQKKCLGKMGEVTKGGRTVLFVSHNMAMIENLCDRCALFKQGKVENEGPTKDVMPNYLADFMKPSSVALANRTDREGTGIIRLMNVNLEVNGRISNNAITGQPCTIRFEYSSQCDCDIPPVIAFTIRDSRSQFLCRLSSEDSGAIFSTVSKRGFLICHIPRLPFVPGEYRITPQLTVAGEVSDYIEAAFVLTVESGDFFGTGRFSTHSPVLIDHRWLLSTM